MKTLDLAYALSTTLVLALGACSDSSSDAEAESASATPDGDAASDGSNEGGANEGGSTGGEVDESTGEEPEDSAGEDGPLQACLDLPEASAAGWVNGMHAEPIAGTAEQLESAGAATWTNALRLLREVHPSGTIAASPLSMMGGAALGYARHGAACNGGLTEMVGFGLEGEALHNTFGALLAELAQRDLPAIEDSSEPIGPVDVSLIPSLWSIGEEADEGSLAPYGAGQHRLSGEDFSAMNTVMNCVIEEQTHGILQDFIPSTLPASDTATIDMLVSYVAAPWDLALEERGPLPFVSEDGSASDVPAIAGEALFGYVYQDDDVAVVTLPMRGEELETTFIMPKTQSLAEFLDASTAESLGELRERVSGAEFDLHMPRVETSAQTIDLLEPLGVECQNFTVRVLLHGASVTIDDNGVAAAAAGAVEGWGSGTGSPSDFELVLDRPYAFFVVDRPTNAVLFNGRFDG